jgi:DNA-binding GntR family transcriptional regulator
MPYSGVAFPQFERPKSMKTHVYEVLKAAILAGSIHPHTVLTEATLAEKFGVSRTPIREVMHELERQGLLERAGPRGKRVRSVSPSEVRELFWIRSVLEPPIASQLAGSGLAEGDLKQLNLLLERQRNALRARDRAEFLAADSAFHILLARLTGFRKVTEIITNLRNLFQLVGMKAVEQAARLEEVLREHQAIVDAIARRDPAAAETAVRSHLSYTETVVLNNLQS